MPNRFLLAAAVAACSLIACKPPEGLECGDNRCTGTQLCDQATLLCVNNVAPVITVESPAPGSFHTGTVIQISGTVIDDEGKVTHAEASGDDGQTWVPVDLGSEGRFSQSLPITSRDSTTLKLLFRSRDHLEQVSETSVDITVDNTAPACAFVSPAATEQIDARASDVYDIEIAAPDGSGQVSGVELRIDGAALDAPAVSGTTYSWKLELPAGANGIVKQFRFSAADPHGNACVLERDVVIDRIVPTMAVTSPANDAQIWRSTDTKARITGTASDGDGPAPTVAVDFGDGQGERVATHLSNGTWFVDIELPEIDHTPRTITARAYDTGGNSVSVTRKAAVDRIPPRVTITSPTEGQLLGNAQLDQNGSVKITWSVEDASPQTVPDASTIPSRSNIVIGLGTAGFATQATDNPQTYEFRLSVTDLAGNTGTLVRRFDVDRVGPSVTFNRTNNSRQNPVSLSIGFGETVTAGNASAITLSPTATATPSPTAYTYTLKSDTVYTATVAPGAVLDAAGNPNTGTTTVTFHTAPAQPSQTTLLSNVEDFDAASDFDGAVILTVRQSSPSRIYLGSIDTVTGALVMEKELATSTTQPIEPVAQTWRSVNGLVATRVRAWKFTEPVLSSSWTYPSQIWWKSGSGSFASIYEINDRSLYPVALPVSCVPAEASADAVGAVRAGEYVRVPSILEYTQLSKPTAVLGASGDVFNVVQISGSEIKLQDRECSCQALVKECVWNQSYGVDFYWKGLKGNDPRFSGVAFADTLSGGLSVVPGAMIFQATNDDGLRYEFCNASCSSNCGFVKKSVPTEAFFARRNSGKRILQATHSGGIITLTERDLGSAAGCNDAGTTLGTLTVQATLKSFRPVMFGLKPGVIYLEGTTLKAWVAP